MWVVGGSKPTTKSRPAAANKQTRQAAAAARWRPGRPCPWREECPRSARVACCTSGTSSNAGASGGGESAGGGGVGAGGSHRLRSGVQASGCCPSMLAGKCPPTGEAGGRGGPSGVLTIQHTWYRRVVEPGRRGGVAGEYGSAYARVFCRAASERGASRWVGAGGGVGVARAACARGTCGKSGKRQRLNAARVSFVAALRQMPEHP